MKCRTTLLICALVCFSFVVLLAGCSVDADDTNLESDAAATFEVGAGEPILDSSHWQSAFPTQVATFKLNDKRSEYHSYLEAYPWLSTIYEGGGFAKGYNSARAHPFAVTDVNETPRISEASPSACFGCKSPQYPIAEARDASGLHAKSFFDVRDQMTQTVSCYDCHLNEPGRGKTGSSLPYPGGFLGSIRIHFNDAFSDVAPANAACGQCHNEYYFNADKAITLPVEMTDPGDIYAFYQSIEFVDYTSTSTGTGHVKAQHPEFQVVAGTVHDRAGLTCASCHLAKTTSNKGQVTSHTITNPLESATIRNSVCLPCHPGTTSITLIEEAQTRTKAQTAAVAERLAAFNVRLGSLVAAGSLSDAQLSEVRALNREATWYWDWVFVENSHGAHNPAQAKACLDKADALLAQAEALLP